VTSANETQGLDHLQVKILIVDDSSDLRVLLARLLKNQGYKTFEAKNGKVALDELKAGLQGHRQPDLILLDSEMEVMNGRDFLLELEKVLPEFFAMVLVVGLSGLDKFTHPKIYRSLRKPVDLERLITVIAAALASKVNKIDGAL